MREFNINDLMIGIARFSGEGLVWEYDPKKFQRFFHDMKDRFPELFEGPVFERLGDGNDFSNELAEHYRLSLRAGLIQRVNGNGKVYFSPACGRFYDTYTNIKFSGKGREGLVGALKEASREFAYRFGVEGK